MRKLRVRRAGAPLLLAALAACSADTSDSDVGIVVDTVDGAPRITTSGAGTWGPEDAWSVGEPSLTLGTLEGPPETSFGRLTGTALDSEGRIYVLDGQASEVRVFDREWGGYLFSFGREGEGPGEFAYPEGLALGPRGRVYVRDSQGSHVSVFEADGTFVHRFRLRRPYFQIGPGTGFWVDERGRTYDRTALDHESDVDNLGVMIYGPDGEPLDTVLAATWTSPKARVTQDGRPRASMEIPYHPSGEAAVAPDGRIATAVGGSYEIRILGPDASLSRTVRRDVAPTPLAGAERDSALARTERRIDYLMEVAEGGELSDWSLPSELPFFSELHVDGVGYLWVARDGYGGRSPTTFDVFAPGGRFLGSLELPVEGFRIRQIGRDFVLGTRTDELDVPQVVVLPLRR